LICRSGFDSKRKKAIVFIREAVEGAVSVTIEWRIPLCSDRQAPA
jgi:hypothetical protein